MARPTEGLTGHELIAAERERQIGSEGFDRDNDSQYRHGELRNAADSYLHARPVTTSPLPPRWPWSADWWKPAGDQVVNLAKAGALIAAEIDRIQAGRENAQPGDPGCQECGNPPGATADCDECIEARTGGNS